MTHPSQRIRSWPQGTPVLIPIKGWDDGKPNDRAKWKTQNPLLDSLSPPYVLTSFSPPLLFFSLLAINRNDKR